MQSKGNNPTEKQAAWREEVRALGCILTGDKSSVEIHHVLGATAKHNKTDIGHWFILPLSGWYHRNSPNLNVTDHKKTFEETFGSQVSLFNRLLELYEFHYGVEPPVDDSVIRAIRDLERYGRTVYK